MFNMTLKAILASFEKVQGQLEAYIASQEAKLQDNLDKQYKLAHESSLLTEDKLKAERVLGRIQQLTE